MAKLALEGTARKLKTFSLTFDDIPQSNERRYIEAVVRTGGMEPHYVAGDRVDPLRSLDKMLRHLDEPFFTPNLFLYWELYQQAERADVRVMLDGFWGDNVVSHGTRYVTELAAKGRWLELARQFRSIARALGESRRIAYPYLFREFILKPLVLERAQRALTAVINPVLPAYPQSRFVNREFAREIGWMQRARAFGQAAPRTSSTAKAEHLSDVQSGAFSHVAEVLNKAAAAFSLTVRLPFADRRLVEYCVAVPATQKLKDGWTRVFARRGLHEDLPEEIRTRYGKRYLGEVLRHGLLTLARDDATSLIMERLPIAASYVDVKATQEAFRKLLGKNTAKDSATVAAIWPAMVLTRWLEIERDSATGANRERTH
jgi:asparagine synthase (glutamine-hydrolysing)